MTEQPINLAREAKSIHQALKESLKTKEPFDKEVDFQRKNLRRRYLNLLLVHPYAKESKDVENHLWMQTSYAFISAYKQRIGALDRAITRPPPPQQQRHSPHGPVEHRKFIQRFRQFLADEEKFWTQLIVRLRRSFALYEAHPTLVALGILSATDDSANPISNIANTANPADGSETREGAVSTHGRNHFQFPPEDTTVDVAPSTPVERETRLAILSKALICLGDIARYRELYNEAGGRPRAGHEDSGPAKRGRNRRGGPVPLDAVPRPRNYDKAQQCYEQARLLVPYEGNPSHQLAILASYQKDSFASLVHYYRALCVRQPYDTAAENLGTVLSKALEQWRARSRRERDNVTNIKDSSLPPRVKVDTFKENVVVLHALWRLGMDKGIEKMDSISRKHDRGVYRDFFALVAERHLPIDLISSSIVLSQGALWKHRMIRDTNQNRTAGTAVIIESRIFTHLLNLHHSLLEVGRDELKEPPPMDAAENDLAQRITATFRRTLPALRIASKWLRANFKYMTQDPELTAIKDSAKATGEEVHRGNPPNIRGHSTTTVQFWQTYAEFLRALSRAFPADKLPSPKLPLEEDVEMRGFLPLKKLMGETAGSPEEKQSVATAQKQEQVHPNVEQLMRIADLLEDAQTLVKMENAPIALYGNQIMLKEEYLSPTVDALRAGTSSDTDIPHNLMTTLRERRLDLRAELDFDEDDMTEITSRTDDDVVRDAFRFLDTSDNEERDDEIVWNPREYVSPVMPPVLSSPPSHASPVTPVRPLLSPRGRSPRSPTHPSSHFSSPAAAPMAPTTAQDLLNDVMGLGRSVNGGALEASALQTPLLFGSELSHGQSIWSASRDEQALKFAGSSGQAGHGYQPQARQYPGSVPPPQDMSQSIWSSYSTAGQTNSQHHLVGALPSAPFAQALPPAVIAHHPKVSSSMVAAQLFPTQHQGPHDIFGYSSGIQHRSDIHASMPVGYGTSPLRPNSGPDVFYENPPLHSYHERQLSIHHDPRVGQPFVQSPMSQIWGNTG